MKNRPTFLLSFLLVASSVSLLTSCTSNSRKRPEPAVSAAVGDDKLKKEKPAKVEEADLDEYSAASVSDPIEPVNRGIFWFNDRVYNIAFRPISKVYETVVPKPMRRGLDNFYENVRFPVRLVNNALQGNFVRARQELEKFLINSSIGIVGIWRQSDRIPSLAEVPAADTGQTFAKWGIRRGPYIVLPVLGPSTLREAVGYAGDSALNPVSWITTAFGAPVWAIAIPSTNTLRSLPHQLRIYDAATENTLDPYLAARSAHIQYRNEVALK
jgi:phospholipid-binding lipoprotein MlaA